MQTDPAPDGDSDDGGGALGDALVPAFVGLPIADAHDLALGAGVVLVSADPDGPLPVAGTVTAQQPLAGTTVPAAGSVAVLVDPGDGGGAVLPAPVRPLDGAGT